MERIITRKNRAIFVVLIAFTVWSAIIGCTGKTDSGKPVDLSADTTAKKTKQVNKDDPTMDTLLVSFEAAVDNYVQAQKDAVNPVTDPRIDKALEVVIEKGKQIEPLIKVASPKQLERYAAAQNRMNSSVK